MARNLMQKCSKLLHSSLIHYQRTKSIHNHVRTALNEIQPRIIRAAPVQARNLNEQRSKFFTAAEPSAVDARASIEELDDQDEAVSSGERSHDQKPHTLQFRNLQRAQPSLVASTQKHGANYPTQQPGAFRNNDLQRSQYFGTSQPPFRNDNFERSQYFGTSQPCSANGTYQSYSHHPERWLQSLPYTYLHKPKNLEATQPYLAFGAKQSAVNSLDQRSQHLNFANLKRPQIIHTSGASQAGSQRLVILKPSPPSHPPPKSRLLPSTFDVPVSGLNNTHNTVRSNFGEQHRFSTFQGPGLHPRQQTSYARTSSCDSHDAQMTEANLYLGARHQFPSLQGPEFLAKQVQYTLGSRGLAPLQGPQFLARHAQSTFNGEDLASLQGPQFIARQAQSKIGGQTLASYNLTGQTLYGNKSTTNKAHRPGIDLDEQEFEIRAAELRLQAAKLDLDRLKKRYAIQNQSQKLQTQQVSVSNHNQLEEGSQGSKENPEPPKRKSNNKGKNSNIYGDYAYTPDGPPNPKTGTQYLSCIQNNGRKCKITGEILKESCLGRAIKYSDGRLVFTGKHTCDEVPLRGRRRDFHNALCDAARNETGFLKDIYDRLAPKYADVTKYMMFHPNVRKSMYYHRCQVQRAWKGQVKNMKQLHEALQTEDAKRALLILEDPEGIAPSVKFETFTVWVDGEPYIGFYDKIWVGKLQGGDVLQLDCTFASRMKIDGLRQLLTVMVRTFNKAFAGVWVNMPTKKEKAYKSVLQEIKTILNIKPRQILVDFELAEQNALKEVFPDATITSCFFHWTQAIWTNALKRKVAYPGMSKKEPEKFEFIRMIMALALLPEEFIVPTYKIIKKQAKDKFGNFFADFCKEYIEGYWINQRKPKTFSVYGQLLKTNNDQESYHRVLNHRFRHVRPAVKNFHNQMLRYAQLQYLVLDGLKEGLVSQPRNPVSAFNEKLLLEDWKKIPQALSPIDFVIKMANEMKRFVKFIEEDVDPEDVNDENEADEAKENEETDGILESPGDSSDDDIVGAGEAICESSMTDEELSKMIHSLDQDVMSGRGGVSDQAKQLYESEKSVNGPTNGDIPGISEPSPGKLLDESNSLAPKRPQEGREQVRETSPQNEEHTNNPESIIEEAVIESKSLTSKPKRPRKDRKQVRETSPQNEEHSYIPESTIEEALSESKSLISKKSAMSRKRARPAPPHTQTAPLTSRTRRQPKPKNFDDYVLIPTKKAKSN